MFLRAFSLSIPCLFLLACVNQSPYKVATSLGEPLPKSSWVRCDLVFDNGPSFEGRYAQLVGVPVADTKDKRASGLARVFSPGPKVLLLTWDGAGAHPVEIKANAGSPSVAFMDSQGYVIHIADSHSARDAIHWPPGRINAALEADRLFLQRYGIATGSRLWIQQCNGPVVWR